jgi:2',3'-cyclic-nucleotide 2'-phosphodiesterase (5'-nucleotidase family)
VKEIREKEKEILVLDAGDLLFKKFTNPIPEHELKMVTEKARLIIESFNLMGYNALGIGDDDLTLGKEFLLEISKKVNFPFLSSNIFDEASEKLLFQPYIIKQINALRIGMFSLLSPDLFLGQSDPRRKGIVVRPAVEVAQKIIKELQPKTDLIILLSHLSYQKDVEFAQTVQGIHLIVGSHTGMNLVYPQILKNSVILQTSPKGMYTGRLDLTLTTNETSFYNLATKRTIENQLLNLKNRLNSPQIAEAEKAQLQKSTEKIEQDLKQFHGKNEFTNMILPLTETMKDHPEILKMVNEFKSKYSGASAPIAPK